MASKKKFKVHQEVELRIAAVAFGGVSLAIYQAGQVFELYNLVLASRAFDEYVKGKWLRKEAVPKLKGTAVVYFSFLEQMLKDHHIHVRAMVDTLAGTSAGGINCIALGFALAKDLDLETVRSTWLYRTDVEDFKHTEKVHWATKVQVRLQAAVFKGLTAAMSKKWWKSNWDSAISWVSSICSGRSGPPEVKDYRFDLPNDFLLEALYRLKANQSIFSGLRLQQSLVDTLRRMEKENAPVKPLLRDHTDKLSLTVTGTHLAGHIEYLPTASGVVEETSHSFELTWERNKRTEIVSAGESSVKSTKNWDPWIVPALAFGARTTSAFPMAFPDTRVRQFFQCEDDEEGDYKELKPTRKDQREEGDYKELKPTRKE